MMIFHTKRLNDLSIPLSPHLLMSVLYIIRRIITHQPINLAFIGKTRRKSDVNKRIENRLLKCVTCCGQIVQDIIYQN